MTPPRGARTRRGDPVNARNHWEKAQRFRAQAEQNADQAGWDGAVSNAILSGIHIVDAVCLHYLRRRNASENHRDALRLLAQAKDLAADARDGLNRHVGALLSMKGFVQYSDSVATPNDAREALQHLDRAFRVARPVAQTAGWSDQK